MIDHVNGGGVPINADPLPVDTGQSSGAMRRVKRFLFIVVVLAACVVCDQATKFIAESVLPADGALSYLGDTVRLQRVYNRGAFLSVGTALPDQWRFLIFTIGSGAFLLALLLYALFGKISSWTALTGIALIVAGGIGNLLDRIADGGVVVDFINVGIGPVRTGIFNVADMAITAGVLIFLWDAWRRKRNH